MTTPPILTVEHAGVSMLALGATAVADLRVGDAQVQRVYLGESLVYDITVSAVSAVNNSSGLTWGSGSSGEMTPQNQFAGWRTRLDDIAVTHVDNNGSMVDLTAYVGTNDPTFYGTWQRHIDISIGAFGRGYDDAHTAANGYAAESWAGAAAGNYNARWTASLQALRTAVLSRTHPVTGQPPRCFIRFAHEWNGDWYPWAVADARMAADPAKGRPASTLADFKAAWVVFRSLQRQHFPEAYVVCCVNREQVGISAQAWDNFMPDADTFDVYGVDYYNHFPYAGTSAQFNTDINGTGSWTSTKGLETHRQKALALGKPMCLPEWGQSASAAAANGGETDAYVNGMHAYFTTHAGSGAGKVLYEAYFNVLSQGEGYNWHIYNPSQATLNPVTAARYAVLWAGGSYVLPAGSSAVKVEDSSTGTGTNQFEYVGSWGNTTAEPGDSGSIRYSLSNTSYCNLRVTGPADVEVWGTKETATGIGAWSVDGGALTNVDTYASPTVRQQKLFSVSVLSGAHTIKWAATGTKNAASLANTITVDYALVTGGAPAFTLGTTKPTEANTGAGSGAYVGVARTTHVGDFTTTSTNQLVQNLRIEGRLIVNHAGGIARNCEIVGAATLASTGQYNLVQATVTAAVGTFRMEHCTVDPRAVNEDTNGVRGTGVELIRCKLLNCVDLVTLVGLDDGSRFEGCFIGKPAYLTPCSYQTDNHTHNDLIQFHNTTGNDGGKNLVSIGNTYSGVYGAKGTHQPSHRDWDQPIISPATDNPSVAGHMWSGFGAQVKTVNMLSEDDWFDGCTYPVDTFSPNGGSLGTYRRPKFDGDSRKTSATSTAHPITFIKDGAVFTIESGTFYAGTFAGQAITVR